MKATEPIRPPDALDLSGAVSQSAHPVSSAHPTAAEVLDEIVPMIGVVPGYGPPVVFLLGPCAILATPYLLARRLHEQRASQTSERLSAAQLVPGRSPRAGL